MVSGQPGDKAALVVSIIAICVSISVLIVSGLSYRLAKKAYNLSKAEPKFEITLEQETPPNPISSQKSDSYRIFEPSPERYSKANSGKNAGRENRITLTNIGEAPSQLTAVEIALKDPFSVSLIAFHVPGLGWLKAYYRNIEYDKLNYQHAIIKIDRKLAKENRLRYIHY